ncbi:restriction endonuclease subunit S [Rhizobium sp. TRM95796]|uniref:restriction endonuclease subunit S n=1 Tax=Rhizobium sp. TRM95796 TaxID=2979862 RepID=UPI0021E8BF90|nr:restriction endonuclease subunit S [Rhizobium sp. TRM95796]MCV3765099.1 restriction endonuclease subunit S [Rhizobium sp. TRM95796]
MNAVLLSALSEAISDHPSHVLQLRKIVVALAVSGRLGQRENSLKPDELLSLLEEGKASLIAKRSLPKQKRREAITIEQLPEDFSDPSLFVSLGEVARVEKGKTGIQQAKPGEYPLVVTAADRLTADHFDFDGAAAIVPLVSSTGHGNASINRLHYQEGQFALGTILAAVLPFDEAIFSARFLFEYLSAFKDELLVSRMSGTANVTLTLGRIEEVPIPLVPPSVQRQVDELMALCDELEAARTERETKRDRLAAASLARLNTPDSETFRDDARFALDALPALTARPDQIKQLRQTILNLAVRGKLVPRDPADEPAEALLKRIAAERDALVRKKEIRRESPLEPAGAHDYPHTIPGSWAWCQAGDAFLFTQYGTSQKAHASQSGVPVLTMGNIQDGKVIWGNEKRIPESSDDLPALYLKKFDILYNRTNSAELVGKTGIYLGDSDARTFASYLIRLRPSLSHSDPVYLNIAMNAPCFRETQIVPLIKKQTGQANVSGSALKNMLIPLPPLAEQHRIVAKVDELMALCDQLETSLSSADETREKLLDALLAEALAPVDANELKEAAE